MTCTKYEKCLITEIILENQDIETILRHSIVLLNSYPNEQWILISVSVGEHRFHCLIRTDVVCRIFNNPYCIESFCVLCIYLIILVCKFGLSLLKFSIHVQISYFSCNWHN